jgi:hypothetical protein
MIQPQRFKKLSNSFSYYLFAFFAIIILSPFISYINYGQPYVVGLRAVRGSFFYIYFFVLLCGIDTPLKLLRYIKYLKITALCLTLVAILQNVLHINVFFSNHSNEIVRVGMNRMINPGLDIVMLVFFILIGNFIYSKKPNRIIDNVLLLILSIQILLSLTRSVIIGCLLTLVLIFIISREYKNAIKVSYAGVMLISCYLFFKLSFGMHSNFGMGIISDLYHLTYSEVVNAKGNVGIRLLLAQTYLKFGFENWFLGTGYISPIGSVAAIIKYPILRQDLGYIIMFSQYGLVGLIWLAGLSLSFFRKGFLLLRQSVVDEYRGIAIGLIGNFIYLLVSFITLPHFIDPDRICVVAINLALFQIIYSNSKKEIKIYGK